KGTRLGHYSLVVFLGKHHYPVYEIPENRDEFIIVPGLEILPGKVIVFGLWRVRRQGIPEHILHILKILQIFMEPDGPVFRCGKLLPFEVEEFVGRHIYWKYIIPMCF